MTARRVTVKNPCLGLALVNADPIKRQQNMNIRSTKPISLKPAPIRK